MVALRDMRPHQICGNETQIGGGLSDILSYSHYHELLHCQNLFSTISLRVASHDAFGLCFCSVNSVPTARSEVSKLLSLFCIIDVLSVSFFLNPTEATSFHFTTSDIRCIWNSLRHRSISTTAVLRCKRHSAMASRLIYSFSDFPHSWCCSSVVSLSRESELSWWSLSTLLF